MKVFSDTVDLSSQTRLRSVLNPIEIVYCFCQLVKVKQMMETEAIYP